MRAGFTLLTTWVVCVNALWLPFANLETMFRALREETLREGADDSDGSFSLADLATVGRDFFSGISRFFSSSFDDEDKRVIANGIREFFNVTTPSPATATATEQPRFTFPYTRPYIPVQEHTVATTPPIRTSSGRIPPTLIASTMPSRTFTTYSPVIIWPTSARTTMPSIMRTRFTWRPVTPQIEWATSTSTPYRPVHQTYATEAPSTTDNIPLIIKARKFTRPPPVIDPITSAPSSGSLSSCDLCQNGKRCQVNLRSSDTMDPVFQYAYSHSTTTSDYMQTILRETQRTSFPAPLSWRSSVAPELIQLTKSLMSLYQPSRCLVIGVFTGLGLLGIAEEVEPRGLIIALEHPSYVEYWENVGLKFAKMTGHAYTSRIQMRSSEPIEKALPKLAANEPNNFDFVFLDDFKRVNYLDDYEHAVRLLRPGGLLIINQALNDGGVLTAPELMTESDRVMSSMNVRIKEDGRVRASLLPYSGGTWIILKK